MILLLVAAILLLGLVMVTSASDDHRGARERRSVQYLERQLLIVAIGPGAGGLRVPGSDRACIERCAPALLMPPLVLLVLVLIPGLGHVVNGGRRWLRFPASTSRCRRLARVLVLIYIASYCVRCETRTAQQRFGGLLRAHRPAGRSSARCCWPSRISARPRVLFVTGFGLLFLAGARLRWVVAAIVGASAAMSALVLFSPAIACGALTGFLDPWADPYNSGFQLTQSLIAIGRGQWFGVGLGASVQKLFYLPEAHTDFLFAVLAEELDSLACC